MKLYLTLLLSNARKIDKERAGRISEIVSCGQYNDDRVCCKIKELFKIPRNRKELLLDASNQTSYVCNTETRVKHILNKLNSTKSVSEVIRYLPEAELPESILYDLVIEILQK